MQGKYDIIIVGSGLGGLVCGYILSKKGFKVAIVEKNAQIGGCLQSFRRKGVNFDTGMHYIGSMDEGQILYRFWKYLGLTETIPLQRLNNDGLTSFLSTAHNITLLRATTISFNLCPKSFLTMKMTLRTM